MVDISLIEKLSAARFRDRFIFAEDGRVLLLGKDRKTATWLTREEADGAANFIAHELEPTRRMLRRSCWLNIPFALSLLGITANVPGLTETIDSLGQVASLFAILVIMAGLPLAMLFRHFRVLRRTLGIVEARFAARTWVATPPLAGKHGLDNVEKLAALIVTPNIIIALINWLVPDTLRGTPFTDTGLSALSLVIIAAIVARRMLKGGPTQLKASMEAPTGPGRRAQAFIRRTND